MTDTEARRDEASRRLGGPSKIGELEERLLELAQQLEEKTEKLEESVKRARIAIGAEIYPSGNLNWHDENGMYTTPSGPCRIEGLGPDWCVLRTNAMRSPVFASTPGLDIRNSLAIGFHD